MENQRQSADIPKWAALLVEAVNKPGLIMEAYSAFHNYSIGNQILALVQCHLRGIQPGPINTFPKWQTLGRIIKRGERALTLCMPITRKQREEESEKEHTYTSFAYKPRWFVLSQTQGRELEPTTIPEWDSEKAISALSIERVAFDKTDGNCQGFARKRQIAINPVAQLPYKTLFHELAHLCCLRSYVVLWGQVVWNEAAAVAGLHITFSLVPYRSALLFAGLTGLTFHAVDKK
jgi:hypothetical protein